MKVCILTYRLHSNFGFLMQAYAMQQIIKQLGHIPYTVDIRVKPLSFVAKLKHWIKVVLLCVSRKLGYPSVSWCTEKEQAYIDRHTWQFVKAYLQLTPSVDSIKDLKRLIGTRYDFYLVGSDQVWRKEYCPRIQSYFFDFLPDNKKRASYAASFGVSSPGYPSRMVDECKRLLAKFSAVSVREADGVRICHELFGVQAVHVLDPTMLLNKADYLNLIDSAECAELPSTPFILAYILDKTSGKKRFVEDLSQNKCMPVYYIKPENLSEVGVKRIEECVYPSISTWLSAFEKAAYVVTDSFHGTVFSIIFQKQFVVLDNPQRGSSRMRSLLSDFSLEDRLLSSNENREINLTAIDYKVVDTAWTEKRERSVFFLKGILNE